MQGGIVDSREDLCNFLGEEPRIEAVKFDDGSFIPSLFLPRIVARWKVVQGQQGHPRVPTGVKEERYRYPGHRLQLGSVRVALETTISHSVQNIADIHDKGVLDERYIQPAVDGMVKLETGLGRLEHSQKAVVGVLADAPSVRHLVIIGWVPEESDKRDGLLGYILPEEVTWQSKRN